MKESRNYKDFILQKNNMITKQQVEGLIERLADKTLSFGCFIKPVQSDPRQIIQVCGQGVFHVESKSFKQSYSNNGEFEVLGHPITIGTVLDKMKEKDILYANAPDPRGDDNAGWILDYWSKCGFSRSLQEIILESEWSHSAHAKVCNVGHEEVLTSPEANALFTFLQEII